MLTATSSVCAVERNLIYGIDEFLRFTFLYNVYLAIFYGDF